MDYSDSFKIERWFVHKWVPGVFHSNEHFGAAVECTGLVAGVGPVEYVAAISPGDCVVTDLATGFRHIVCKEHAIGLPL